MKLKSSLRQALINYNSVHELIGYLKAFLSLQFFQINLVELSSCRKLLKESKI